MEKLKEKIIEIISKKVSILLASEIEKLAEELLNSIHEEYDPIQLLKDMVKTDPEIYKLMQEGIAMNFKNLVQYNQILDNIPIVVFDEMQVNSLANQAAVSFINLFCGIESLEKEEATENN